MRLSHLLMIAMAACLLLAAGPRVEASQAAAQAQAEVSALAELESWLVASDFEDSLAMLEAAPAPAAAAAAATAAPPSPSANTAAASPAPKVAPAFAPAAAPAPAAAAAATPAAAAASATSSRLAGLKAKLAQANPKFGTVRRGGYTPPPDQPDLSQGAEDGSELPPFDPFEIAQRHEAMQARRQARRQAQVDKVTAAESAKASAALAKRRTAQLQREQAEAKAEAAMEARAKAEKDPLLGQQVETDLMEVDAEAEAEHEVDVDAEHEAEMEAEMEAEAEAEAEAESELDAGETELMELHSALSSEMEAEAEAELEAELDSELQASLSSATEADAEADAEALVASEDAALSELDVPENLTSEPLPDAYASAGSGASLMETASAPLLPSMRVTYGREDLAEEQFSNEDSRAVFARRRRGQEIVRFERTLQSDGGVAVVKGVNTLPCDKEVTDRGLSAASVQANPGPTVAAANPAAPVWHDDNIVAIKALPVAPEYQSQQTVDQYGDDITE